MMKHENFPFDFEYDTFLVSAVAALTTDSNYGADADGNRGSEVIHIMNIDLINILDHNGVVVNNLSQKMRTAIIDYAYDLLEDPNALITLE